MSALPLRPVPPAASAYAAGFIAAIEQAVARAPGTAVGLHEPHFGGNEWAYVKDCLNTGWVSSVGAYVTRFEQMLAEFTGVRHAVAVVNGTAALHLCLVLAGIRAGDEVLVPTLTFIATANAVSYCGATPHLVDCSPVNLGVDAEKLRAYLLEIAELRDGACVNKRTGARIAAILPMHVFGLPVDMDAVAAVCAPWGIKVVEDAAESLGSCYKGRHTGHSGLVAALSFNGNKVVTTGGGGAILTDDDALAGRAKHLSTTARVAHQWSFIHDEVGYNYRMPNLNAALGCAQLEQLPGFLQRKRHLAAGYQSAFAGMAGVRVLADPPWGQSNFWLNAVLLEGVHAHRRDELLAATNAAGLMTRPVWTLMHQLPMYAAAPRMDLSVAEDIQARLINLPSSAMLGTP
jgi:perosamine synthetase